LDAQLSKAAQRGSVSKGEWVRRALQEHLRKPTKDPMVSDPLRRLESLGAPTAGIDRMLAEIDAGRR
jgi:hypothetical protein